MMNLYSGTTCPFSQRCRIVLYALKGMDFQIIGPMSTCTTSPKTSR